MTSFEVHYGAHEEVIDWLRAAVGAMGHIKDNLNHDLAGMNRASHGRATPLWEREQLNWDRAYEDMKTHLNGAAQAAANIHDTFNHGDRRSEQIMS